MSVEVNLKDKLSRVGDWLSPVTILEEYADIIKTETNGLVVPVVEHHDKAPEAYYDVAKFLLTTPSLPYYGYRLMTIWYRIDEKYDLEFFDLGESIEETVFKGQYRRCATSGNDFKEKASAIITCPRAVKVMNEIIQAARAKTKSDTPDITIIAEPAPPTVKMTAEEAVQILNDAKFADELQGDERVATASLMARDALILQIPQKPEQIILKYRQINICPRCGSVLRFDDAHCVTCGQALKWRNDG